jgi:hypothetical protein
MCDSSQSLLLIGSTNHLRRLCTASATHPFICRPPAPSVVHRSQERASADRQHRLVYGADADLLGLALWPRRHHRPPARTAGRSLTLLMARRCSPATGVASRLRSLYRKPRQEGKQPLQRLRSIAYVRMCVNEASAEGRLVQNTPRSRARSGKSLVDRCSASIGPQAQRGDAMRR